MNNIINIIIIIILLIILCYTIYYILLKSNKNDQKGSSIQFVNDKKYYHNIFGEAEALTDKVRLTDMINGHKYINGMKKFDEKHNSYIPYLCQYITDSPTNQIKPGDKYIVVGDVHGSILQLFMPLKQAGIITAIRYNERDNKFDIDPVSIDNLKNTTQVIYCGDLVGRALHSLTVEMLIAFLNIYNYVNEIYINGNQINPNRCNRIVWVYGNHDVGLIRWLAFDYKRRCDVQAIEDTDITDSQNINTLKKLLLDNLRSNDYLCIYYNDALKIIVSHTLIPFDSNSINFNNLNTLFNIFAYNNNINTFKAMFDFKMANDINNHNIAFNNLYDLYKLPPNLNPYHDLIITQKTNSNTDPNIISRHLELIDLLINKNKIIEKTNADINEMNERINRKRAKLQETENEINNLKTLTRYKFRLNPVVRPDGIAKISRRKALVNAYKKQNIYISKIAEYQRKITRLKRFLIVINDIGTYNNIHPIIHQLITNNSNGIVNMKITLNQPQQQIQFINDLAKYIVINNEFVLNVNELENILYWYRPMKSTNKSDKCIEDDKYYTIISNNPKIKYFIGHQVFNSIDKPVIIYPHAINRMYQNIINSNISDYNRNHINYLINTYNNGIAINSLRDLNVNGTDIISEYNKISLRQNLYALRYLQLYEQIFDDQFAAHIAATDDTSINGFNNMNDLLKQKVKKQELFLMDIGATFTLGFVNELQNYFKNNLTGFRTWLHNIIISENYNALNNIKTFEIGHYKSAFAICDIDNNIKPSKVYVF